LVAILGSALAVGASAATLASPAIGSSCKSGATPAIVKASFTCLIGGGRCTAALNVTYAKYGFACIDGRLGKKAKRRTSPPPAATTPTSPAPPVSTMPVVADAFLNTAPDDLTTRLSSYPYLTAPPVLHIKFAVPLVGNHSMTVTYWNFAVGIGRTLDGTLQPGWTNAYLGFPGASSNFYTGTYQVTISIDGRAATQLQYTITG
jgi:hypothetical protein